MICVNCNLTSDELEGVINISQCDHFICLECVTILVQEAQRKILRCPSNKGKRKVTCNGYLDHNEIKYLIAEEVYDEYLAKFDDEPRPSTSQAAFSQQAEFAEFQKSDSASYEYYANSGDDYEEEDNLIGSLMTFEELNLSPEEERSGWGQMASYINELMITDCIPFYEATAHVDLMPLWITTKPSFCPICQDEDIPPGEGIILKDCFHIFCRECIAQHVVHSSDVSEVKCPFSDGKYSCSSCLKPNELRALTSQEVYDKHYNELSLHEAEKSLRNVFHCLTPDCKGFCVFDDDDPSGIFECPICKARSCLSCKAIHLKTCTEYWQQIEAEEERLRQLQREEDEKRKQAAFDERNRLEQRKNEEMSQTVINGYLGSKVFMRCPRCNIPCYKHSGCNHVVCGSCKHSFNWAGQEPSLFK